MEEEVWKDVEGYEEYYKVSSRGRVMRKKFTLRMKNGRKRLYREQECKQMVTKSCVVVSILGKTLSVAKLVADAFMNDGEKHYLIYHKNGDIKDNNVNNLSYTNEKIIFDKDENLSEKDYLMKYYDVSKDGVIKRKSDGKVLKNSVGPKGYLIIRLKSPKYSINKDRRKPYKVHRLVAMFYLDNYSEDLQVNHKNGIKTDNRVENLEMVTNQQNVLHAWRVLDSSERRRKISEANKRRKYNKKNI